MMDNVHGRNPLLVADAFETLSETSSPAESGLPFKEVETEEKSANLEDAPTLSTQASSVTLTVNEEETVPKLAEGNPKGPTLGAVQSDSNTAVKPTGWPARRPFRNKTFVEKNGGTVEWEKEDLVFWADLTWKQKNAWRKAFLTEYLSETKDCLPFVWRLYRIIYRLSPWRAVVLLGVSIFRGFLPALTLQTRGNFIMMVTYGRFWLIEAPRRVGKKVSE
jgi:hypothetical protein